MSFLLFEFHHRETYATAMGTAATVAAVVHKDEKTIRMWRKEFKEVWGKFSEDGRGRYGRTTIIHDRSADKMGS